MTQFNFRGIKQAGLKMILAATTLAALSGNALADGGSFEVDAKDNSTGSGGTLLDTGLVFGAGDKFTVTTTGIWSGDTGGSGFCFDVSAAGSPCFGGSIPNYSLVGRFDNGSYFLIGNGGTFTSTGGELYLGFYDVDSANNGGKITATITTAVPEPSTYAMMLAGLAVLVIRRRRQS